MQVTSYWGGLIKTFDDVFDTETLHKMCAEIESLPFHYGMVDSKIEVPDISEFIPFFIEDGNQERKNKFEYVPTGMSTCNGDIIPDLTSNYYYQQCWNFFENHVPELDGLRSCRDHVNCFAPMEAAYYHQDSLDDPNWTVLMYANRDWQHDDMGETKFIIKPWQLPYSNDIDFGSEENNYPIVISVAPIPGRIVMFKGEIDHAASPFRKKHRFTAAWQFINIDDEKLPKCTYKGK